MKRNHQNFVRLIRNRLGNAARHSGKIFYSPPCSLFAGRYILMGFNPGGDPASRAESTINENLEAWSKLRENHYWSERWNTKRNDFNRLQKQVHTLLENLGIKPVHAFTSNLWFVRSRDASRLKHSHAAREACIEVWKEFLARSPARRIICIGVRTAREFLEEVEAVGTQQKTFRTRHRSASALLICAKIEGKVYKIAAVPHLSRFSVANDLRLIRAIQRHFD